MAKYNIGDHVKVNDQASLWGMDYDIGDEGIIQAIDARQDRPGDPWYLVAFDAKPAALFPQLTLDPV